MQTVGMIPVVIKHSATFYIMQSTSMTKRFDYVTHNYKTISSMSQQLMFAIIYNYNVWWSYDTVTIISTINKKLLDYKHPLMWVRKKCLNFVLMKIVICWIRLQYMSVCVYNRLFKHRCTIYECVCVYNRLYKHRCTI